MLNGKQRAALRAKANGLDTIFQIGKNGITDETLKQVSAALEARELIKLRVLETAPYNAKEASEVLCEKLGAEGIACVGYRFVIYRESQTLPKEKRISVK